MRRRADIVLVEHGHFESRSRARAAIEAGLVTADGVRVSRASDLLGDEARIEAEAPHPWVSRGGVKLAAGLDAFGMEPAGKICLDVGASTGGFTDVLLSRGAERVYSVDVGRGQLHPRIAADPRVVALEATDIRTVGPDQVPDAVALAVVDVGFISLRLVLPAVLDRMAPRAEIVALVKPQFEAGRDRVGRGGIVRDEAVRQDVLRGVRAFAEGLGLMVRSTIASPIAGGDGNVEFLLAADRG